MLVLTRKSREAVVIGGGGGFAGIMKITVLKVTGDKVTLGFEVDAGIPVNRQEVWERMCANGEVTPEAPQARAG
jgi:carbon storage regulator CsrA